MLLVAPAEPSRFGVATALPQSRLAMHSCVVASDNDPWMSATEAHAWALRWGSDWINLGNAGHINVDSGYGPFPLAREWAAGALNGSTSGPGASRRDAAAGTASCRDACPGRSSPKSSNPAPATPIAWRRSRVTCARSGGTRARSRASGSWARPASGPRARRA